MTFQATVNLAQGFGVVGEIQYDGPTRARPGIVKQGSAGSPNNIIVGSAYTIDSADGQYQPGGTGVFGGIMVQPKGLASIGTQAGGPLAPTIVVPAGTACQFLTMGEILVSLPAAAAIGAGIYFNNADGTLGVGTAGAGQTQIANATVVRYANAAAGLAVVSFTGA